ncbi:thioredoxin-like protein [Thamnocephalis sphaerospora]|uniref:Monothiol glutaredoxin-5, mitochondrial n=1 Tax=Thamnocephalis sphaerospora TaxID=78915 RepID=A0A4V1IW73_9FUNG|nr:thioredoxin-like protein [Thamnocephalis sphaerospora]|eukprot:RKP06559.1 thioredoxin-like protein [Thamnocephalis sphaerospora]
MHSLLVALRQTSRPVAASAARTVRWSPAAFQARRMITDRAKKLIEESIKDNDVCVFMKGTPEAPQCGFSRAVAQILDVQGVTQLKALNVLADPDLREGIKEFSSWPTIPQVYIKGEFIGGCDIMLDMHRSGQLEDLLLKEGIVEPLPEDKPAA